MSTAEELIQQASTLRSTNPAKAEALYKQVLNTTSAADALTAEKDQSLRHQETALVNLGELYRDQKNAKGVSEVITLSRSFMSSTAKAKTAKLIRTLLDFFTPIPNSHPIQIEVLQDNIAWAKQRSGYS
ncbi:26S proteasome regulatory subunit rpn6 [Steccherinum ochraceum]|uniref:26S proteasome regulatory subunit rpn6 n=1 Tax=Steccherinum ochraceum TaxID=92696 RepID=A0A4R0RFD9_9APHY|nr:26S proteasome regulatory subunit rpn6 [Steccherinum ochraceum]